MNSNSIMFLYGIGVGIFAGGFFAGLLITVVSGIPQRQTSPAMIACVAGIAVFFAALFLDSHEIKERKKPLSSESSRRSSLKERL